MQDFFDATFDMKTLERDMERDLAAATPANLINGAFLEAYRAWMATGKAPQLSPEELLVENGVPRGALSMSMTAMMLRDLFVAEFGYAVPTSAFPKLMMPLGPVIEVGAGRGYLSHVLRHAGIDSIATDADPGHMKAIRNRLVFDEIGPADDHGFPVEVMTAEEAIVAHPGRTVLCSWPCYNSDWITQAVKKLASGQAIAVIGEGSGGCTGEGGLFELAEDGFLNRDTRDKDLQSKAIWSFPGIHDRLRIFRRP